MTLWLWTPLSCGVITFQAPELVITEPLLRPFPWPHYSPSYRRKYSSLRMMSLQRKRAEQQLFVYVVGRISSEAVKATPFSAQHKCVSRAPLWATCSNTHPARLSRCEWVTRGTNRPAIGPFCSHVITTALVTQNITVQRCMFSVKVSHSVAKTSTNLK